MKKLIAGTLVTGPLIGSLVRSVMPETSAPPPRRRLARLLVIATLLGTGTVAVPAAPALAADGCGSGYHKQEDGVISGSRSASFDGKSMTARQTGYVRWCTRDRNNMRDQWFQRVMVGVPTPMKYRATFSGSNRTKICMTAAFTAYIEAGSSADISIGTDGGSVTISSRTGDSKTVRRKQCVTGSAAQTTSAIGQAFDNFSATAKSVSWTNVTCPYIRAVKVETIAEMTYTYGSEVRSYALRSSNTDKPNNLPTVGC